VKSFKTMAMKKTAIVIVISFFVACGPDEQRTANESKNGLFHDSINHPETDALDEAGLELMGQESLGQLKLGLSATELKAILGEPTKKSGRKLWEADGELHQTWEFVPVGIIIDMIGDKNANVGMIMATSPCKFKTSKGIGIGSERKDVEKAYSDLLNPDYSSHSSLVAGSLYGGVIFNFENDMVASIFIGSMAE
jgi:hypothetical protein